MPNGPALFGPMRFCIPAMILRSNHTMKIVATRATAKITRIFDPDDGERRPLQLTHQQRVEGDHVTPWLRRGVRGAEAPAGAGRAGLAGVPGRALWLGWGGQLADPALPVGQRKGFRSRPPGRVLRARPNGAQRSEVETFMARS